MDVIQMFPGSIGLLLNRGLLSGCGTSLALIGSGCIVALRCIHLVRAVTREMFRLPTSKTTFSRSASSGVVARVVVTSSSRTLLHSLAMGVVFVGAISWN
jgi:hypothetical protein